jgi:hypothetical protein
MPDCAGLSSQPPDKGGQYSDEKNPHEDQPTVTLFGLGDVVCEGEHKQF